MVTFNFTNAMVTCEIKLFQRSSTSDCNKFISALGTFREIISETYRSSSIFSNMFSVGEIILIQFQKWSHVK